MLCVFRNKKNGSHKKICRIRLPKIVTYLILVILCMKNFLNTRLGANRVSTLSALLTGTILFLHGIKFKGIATYRTFINILLLCIHIPTSFS